MTLSQHLSSVRREAQLLAKGYTAQWLDMSWPDRSRFLRQLSLDARSGMFTLEKTAARLALDSINEMRGVS